MIKTNNSNHLFGFHDLIAFNASDDKILGLEVNTINRPPLPGEKIKHGYADSQTGEFFSISTTNAFNYPQGARQQWIDNDRYIVNNQIGVNWGSEIFNTVTGKLEDQFECPVHFLTKDNRWGFGLDYERIHRLGGYGYIGIDDNSATVSTPTDKGIWLLDMNSKQKKLLVSICQVAQFGNENECSTGYHHYLTHIVLNPSNTRIAFLHRFFLADGGIRTRLMTIGVEGNDLRCLAVGFLSHFDWKDDYTLFIWGRTGLGVDSLRSNMIFSNPLIKPLLGITKKITKSILSQFTNQLEMSFLLISDSDELNIKSVATDKLTEDGHPMFNPSNRDYIVIDNYPDKSGVRTLMLYQFSTNKRIELGKYKKLNEEPDMTMFQDFTKGVDKKIMHLISPRLYSFSRSGLHCDLHPRWNADGTKISFDSIHEGSRQIYIEPVQHLIK